MFPILRNEKLAENTHRLDIRAPRICNSYQTGQFVIIRPSETGERIPLTVANSDPQELTITVVVQVVGESTRQLVAHDVGDELKDVVGPLGEPTDIGNFEHVVCCGGGVGIALIWPIARALRRTCDRVTGIISARQADRLILEDELSDICDELKIATDDGSRGYHGFPTDVLQPMIDSEEPPDGVYAVGPVPMMAAISDQTREPGIKTVVSLNPIMVDGTGMCGGCRVSVGGETKFACLDGPEFDAHEVDFEELMHRLQQYEQQPEARELPRYESAHQCDRRHTDLEEASLKEGREADKPTDIPRQPMPEQDPDSRIRNFEEVPLGYTEEQAVLEAKRCLQCKNPSCVEGCPVGIDIPGFIELIKERKFEAATDKVLEDNTLPSVCGRVCPQENQCEETCVLGRKGDPVAIGHLERFAGEYGPERKTPEQTGSTKDIPVAVVGSGPAGLTAAAELARRGYDATVFEALHHPGGVLSYGIPEFRLPKRIVHEEVEQLEQMGVDIECNFVVGKTETVRGLFEEGFGAIFLGTGAGLPILPGLPGENLNGVMSANEYLTRSNLMKAYREDYQTPVLTRSRVAVLGAGNVAMDAARTALRLGADEVTIVYRRTRNESKARIDELEHAEEEGIQFRWLENPVEILGDEDGWVKGLRCVKMELGEPGADGRPKPYPIEGSEFDLPMDMVIVAFGNRPHPLLPRNTKGLQTNEDGTIAVDEATGETSLENVYAGGDIVTGAATVIQAMGAGKRAARAIDDKLSDT